MSTTCTAHAARLARLRLQIALNNLAKRIKRVAFGMTNWTNYRTRALL